METIKEIGLFLFVELTSTINLCHQKLLEINKS